MEQDFWSKNCLYIEKIKKKHFHIVFITLLLLLHVKSTTASDVIFCSLILMIVTRGYHIIIYENNENVYGFIRFYIEKVVCQYASVLWVKREMFYYDWFFLSVNIFSIRNIAPIFNIRNSFWYQILSSWFNEMVIFLIFLVVSINNWEKRLKN